MSKAKLDPQILDLENKWKRALADYDNLQKRITREKEEFVKLANLILIDKLLDVLENLERVEKHVKDQGLELAVGQLREVLQAEGLEEIEVLGKQFDAQTMECVEQVKGEENQVLAVLTKGYKINGRVIRPAKVKVGNGEKEVKDE
jgi:molecular chaperone GrpE